MGAMCVWLEAIFRYQLEAEGNNSLPGDETPLMASVEQPRGEPSWQGQLAVKGPTKVKAAFGVWLMEMVFCITESFVILM